MDLGLFRVGSVVRDDGLKFGRQDSNFREYGLGFRVCLLCARNMPL